MSQACSRGIARGCYETEESPRDFRGFRTFPGDFPRAMPAHVIPGEDVDNRIVVWEEAKFRKWY